MKNILFRADSSSTIGIGHIMRDLVLALQYKDDNIIFASQELKGNINHKILEFGYKIETVDSNDVEEVINLIKKLSIDMIIIDSYDIGYVYEKELKEKTGVEIFVLDDTYEKHFSDILLNHNIYGNKVRYKGLVPNKCELRCGSKYTLLREEFIQEKSNRKLLIKKSKEINVFVSMGGADHSNINIDILKVLESFPNLKVHIVTTTANANLDELKEYLLKKKNMTLHVNTKNVAKLMSLSDFAIVTPSVSVNEVFYLQIPFIAIKTAQNQNEMYSYLQEHDYAVLEKFDHEELHRKVGILIEATKVELVNFTELSLDEKKMVLKWRNNANIRKWMLNKDEISLQSHLQYIESLKAKTDRLYFLVKKGTQAVGVIDFTNIDNCEQTADFGVYANPALKGLGNLLMKSIINYAFEILHVKKLTAEVFKDNESGINLYSRHGFKKNNNNENLTCMELKYEDW